MTRFQLSGETIDHLNKIRIDSDFLEDSASYPEVINHLAESEMIRSDLLDGKSYEERVSDKQEELRRVRRGESVEELQSDEEESVLSEKQQRVKDRMLKDR